MGRLDPSLQSLLQQNIGQLLSLGFKEGLALEVLEPTPGKVRVLLHFNGSLEPVVHAGFEPTSVAGDVAAGFAPLSKLEQIAAVENVSIVESSRPLISELDRSVREMRADLLHKADPPCRGTGVIVGVIDSGVDYTHKCFRTEKGDTRILAIWDQNLEPIAQGEAPPEGFTYGVEYTKEVIDKALQLGDHTFEVVRHKDRGHGTVVTGVAAGNGSAAGLAVDINGSEVDEEKPSGTYVGVAPDADIIVVAYNSEGFIGESANALDAVKYLLKKAETLSRPVVINISQGDYFGPHDGTSLLERGIDNLLGRPGQAIVKAAGNAKEKNTHASGAVPVGGMARLSFTVPEQDDKPDTIDIWYAGSDRFDVSIRQPNGALSNVIGPGPCPITLTLLNKNQVYLESSTCYPINGDNRIYIQLKPGLRNFIEQGNWEILLTGTKVVDGRFHAWIDRSRNPVPEFTGALVNDDCTISIPGTSAKIITVGAYITRDQGAVKNPNGSLAPYSGLGPTRDGREKPEITAPGESVISVRRGASGNKQYFLLGGTSMSAPHVTGVIALLLQKEPTLTQEQIKDILCKYARSDSFTESPPKGWGSGKLDAQASCNALTFLN